MHPFQTVRVQVPIIPIIPIKNYVYSDPQTLVFINPAGSKQEKEAPRCVLGPAQLSKSILLGEP